MIRNAVWKCTNCGEEFLEEYNDNQFSNDIDVEDMLYEVAKDHLIRCLNAEDFFQIVKTGDEMEAEK